MKRAKTTCTIEVRAYGLTILAGVEFDVLLIANNPYSVCCGLPGISLVWKDEFVLI